MAAAALLVAALPLLLDARAFGYGDDGHRAVGAIADGRLKGTPIGAKVLQLVDGLTLEEVAVIPDRIKNWDQNKPYHLHGHSGLENQLREYWSNNLHEAPNGEKLHHVFHYTDISIATDNPKYQDGAIGTYAYDVVHMISYCINVLTGKIPEYNERRITKPIAVILLTHLLGDTHQPLHVGAAYFDDNDKIVNPSSSTPYREDRGGNEVLLFTVVSGHQQSLGKLHHYWDVNTVLKAFNISASQFDSQLVQTLISSEPTEWKPAAGSNPTDWPKAWADEILPIAREAHMRLKFEPSDDPSKFKAVIHDASGQTPYDEWAAGVVKGEIHKGGWRLAFLLEQIVN